ncbi:hypothetical protein Tco_1198099, partial [Tanacetum coccineum]
MANLTFANSHNMVAYLEKSEDNADFAEIVDFINASPIRYALTVSPTGYVSYIEQFWSTAKIKTVNNETQIRAKVDGKTIVITESSVMIDLHFDDKDAVFNDEYDTPSHTKKVFTNTRRQGKDFSGTVIPLFATILVQSQAVEGEADDTIHEERGDSMERAASTPTSLDAEQGSGNIYRTQSTAIPNDLFHQGIGSGGSPRRQDTILGDRPAQTRFERLSKQSNDSPIPRINTLGSDEGKIQGRYGHDMEFDFDFDAAKKVSTTEKDVSTAEPFSTAGVAVTTTSVDVSIVSLTRNIRVSTADDITMAETMVYIRKSAVKDK